MICLLTVRRQKRGPRVVPSGRCNRIGRSRSLHVDQWQPNPHGAEDLLLIPVCLEVKIGREAMDDTFLRL